TLEEMVQALSLGAISRETIERYHANETETNGWIKNGQLINWRAGCRTWAVQDRQRAPLKAKKSAGASDASVELRQIETELDWQKNPTKRAALKKRRAELEQQGAKA